MHQTARRERFKLDTSAVSGSRPGVKHTQVAHAGPHNNSPASCRQLRRGCSPAALTQGERTGLWAHQQGEGYVCSSRSSLCPKQQSFRPPRAEQPPGGGRLSRAAMPLGKRHPQEGAPRHTAWTDVGEEAVLSPGLHHTAALQHFKGIATAAAGPPAPTPHPEEKAPRLEACGCRAWTRGLVWSPPLIHKAP